MHKMHMMHRYAQNAKMQRQANMHVLYWWCHVLEFALVNLLTAGRLTAKPFRTQSLKALEGTTKERAPNMFT